jgi:hypothetical protein
MSAPRPQPRLSKAPHICSACGLPLLQPDSARPEGRGWRVVVNCPSCGWIAEQLLDQDELDRFDVEFANGLAELTAALDYITRINMRSYADRFTAALAKDAILPQDF